MNRYIALFLLMLVLSGRVQAALPVRPWRVYTGLNTVYDIKLGSRYVWFATDGGLVISDRGTGTLRRLDVGDGLPGLGVCVVTPESGTGDSAWLLVRSETWNKNYLVRVTLSKPDAGPRIQSWIIPATDGQRSVNLQRTPDRILLAASPARVDIDDGLDVWTFARASQTWTTTARTRAEIDAWNQQHQRQDLEGHLRYVVPVREKGQVKSIYVIQGDDYDKVTEFFPGKNLSQDKQFHNLVLPAPSRGPEEQYSRLLHPRTSGNALVYDVIGTHTNVLPGGLLAYDYTLLTWRRDTRSANGWKLLSRRPLTDEETTSRKNEIARTFQSSAFASLRHILALALVPETDTLWMGGEGRLLRYNLREGRAVAVAPEGNEVRLGLGFIGHFGPRGDRPVLLCYPEATGVGGTAPIRYSYIPARNTWTATRITDKEYAAGIGPQWRKVLVPLTLRPDEKLEELAGRIAAQEGKWQWLLWKDGPVKRIGEFPTPFTSPPVRLDSNIGRTRHFRELFGYHTYAVAPYGNEGSAWFLAAPFRPDSSMGSFVLYHYDAPSDTLRKMPTALQRTPGSLGDKSLQIVATTSGTVVVASPGTTEPLLRIKPDFTAQSIPFPDKRPIRGIYVSGNRIVLSLAERNLPNDLLSFWLVDRTATQLRPVPVPPAIRALAPRSVFVLGDRLWLAGTGVAYIILSAP